MYDAIRTRNGKLILHYAWGDKDAPPSDLEIPYHGELCFYTSLKRDGGGYETYECRAQFTHGRLESISRRANE
jgi:hypothetical protein